MDDADTNSDTQGSTLRTHKQFQKLELQRRHIQEKHDKLQDEIQLLEHRLDIQQRWDPSLDCWKTAEEKGRRAKFQKRSDHLEGLLVQRLLEMSKLHMSGTGKYFFRPSACLSLTTTRIQTAKAHWRCSPTTLSGNSECPERI